MKRAHDSRLASLPPAREAALHAQLLAREPWAAAELVRLLLPRLVDRLRTDFPGLRTDPDLEGCALQALAAYLLQPERYRPERGSLWTYLHLAADRDARNLVKQRARVAQYALPLSPARGAGYPSGWNEPLRAVLGDVPGLPEGVTLAEVEAQVRASLPAAGDRRILVLMMREDASFENCVAALGIGGLDRAARERAVKRARDRVWAAIRRVRQRYRNG